MESPLKLLARHGWICGERDYLIKKHCFEASAKAYACRNVVEKEALLSLGPWGMELFRQCVEESKEFGHDYPARRYVCICGEEEH